MEINKPIETVVRFASSLAYDDIPSTVVASAKRIVLDTLGCALAATTLGDGCRETFAVMAEIGGRPESSVFGLQKKLAAPNAAFVNGALVHALNYDPIGGEIGHIGIVCLAAPFAMAEAVGGVSGKEFLTSSVAACEITARVTAAVVRAQGNPGDKFLAGQALSYFGAAVGAGRVLNLDIAEMHSALGLALMQMSGSRQIVLGGDPPAKAVFGAFPNHGGVMAALLARAGLRATCDVFGEPAGLYAMIYNSECDPKALTEGLGRDFWLMQAEFKPWPISNKINGFVEAAIEIAMAGIRISDIAEIEIWVHSNLSPWCEPTRQRRRPQNSATAANSIPFCVAKAIATGNVTLTDFTGNGLQHADTLALAERITCHFDDRREVALIKTKTRDGHWREAKVRTPLGSPARPISDEWLTKKFYECCRHAKISLSDSQIKQIVAMIYDLDRIDDVRQVAAVINGQGLGRT